jgi:inosine-uridine nucleoside N-ribohydrolase
MARFQKYLGVAVLCGSMVGAWHLITTQTVESKTVAAVTQSAATASDTFASDLNQQVTSVTRLANHKTTTVIFDSDASSDDALALMLIANDPTVNLQAITVAGTGEAHAEPGAKNMAAVARLIGKSGVPVAYGRSEPLTKAGKPFPDFFRVAIDNLLEHTSIKPDASLTVSGNAVQLMKQTIEASEGKVAILATGPLTNVAELMTQYPNLKNRIEKIVVMGGAVKVAGNIDDLDPKANNKVSEWNFYADPAAAQRVVASGVPIVLIGLDATNQVPITKSFYEGLRHEDQPDLKLAYQMLKVIADQVGEKRFTEVMYLWDGLAAMVMVDPSVAVTEKMPLVVNPVNGQIKVAGKGEHGTQVNVVTRINHADFTLNKFVAIMKSNHIFAGRKLNKDTTLNS